MLQRWVLKQCYLSVIGLNKTALQILWHSFITLFSPSERNYCTTERELLAIVLAAKIFRLYLAGKHFDLITDHRDLTWMNEILMLFMVGEGGGWNSYNNIHLIPYIGLESPQNWQWRITCPEQDRKQVATLRMTASAVS